MSLNSTANNQDVERVAAEIAQYLQQRQRVADTIEGIMNWWLMRQRLVEEREKVELAVQYLCEHGLIQQRVLQDGSIIYTASKNADQP